MPEAMTEQYDLRRLLKTLRASTWLILLLVVIAGAGAYAVSLATPARYRSAETLIYLPAGGTIDITSDTATRDLQTAVGLVQAAPVLAPSAKPRHHPGRVARERVWRAPGQLEPAAHRGDRRDGEGRAEPDSRRGEGLPAVPARPPAPCHRRAHQRDQDADPEADAAGQRRRGCPGPQPARPVVTVGLRPRGRERRLRRRRPGAPSDRRLPAPAQAQRRARRRGRPADRRRRRLRPRAPQPAPEHRRRRRGGLRHAGDRRHPATRLPRARPCRPHRRRLRGLVPARRGVPLDACHALALQRGQRQARRDRRDLGERRRGQDDRRGQPGDGDGDERQARPRDLRRSAQAVPARLLPRNPRARACSTC